MDSSMLLTAVVGLAVVSTSSMVFAESPGSVAPIVKTLPAKIIDVRPVNQLSQLSEKAEVTCTTVRPVPRVECLVTDERFEWTVDRVEIQSGGTWVTVDASNYEVKLSEDSTGSGTDDAQTAHCWVHFRSKLVGSFRVVLKAKAKWTLAHCTECSGSCVPVESEPVTVPVHYLATRMKLKSMPDAIAANAKGKIPLHAEFEGIPAVTVQEIGATVKLNNSIEVPDGSGQNSGQSKFLGGDWVKSNPSSPPSNGSTNSFTFFFNEERFASTALGEKGRTTQVKVQMYSTIRAKAADGTELEGDLESGEASPAYFVDRTVPIVHIGVDDEIAAQERAIVNAVPYYRRKKDSVEEWVEVASNGTRTYSTTKTWQKTYCDHWGGENVRQRLCSFYSNTYPSPAATCKHPYYKLVSNVDNRSSPCASDYSYSTGETWYSDILGEEHGAVWLHHYGLKDVSNVGRVIDCRAYQGREDLTFDPGARAALDVQFNHGNTSSFSWGNFVTGGTLIIAGFMAAPWTGGQSLWVSTGAYSLLWVGGGTTAVELHNLMVDWTVLANTDEGGNAKIFGGVVINKADGTAESASPVWGSADGTLGSPTGSSWEQKTQGSVDGNATVRLQTVQANVHKTWKVFHNSSARAWARYDWFWDFYAYTSIKYYNVSNEPNKGKAVIRWELGQLQEASASNLVGE